MKNLLTILLFITFQNFYTQKLEFSTLLEDKVSIRAIEIWDGKVWYAGTESKFGFVDLKNSENNKQIKLSEKPLQFRTLAQDKTHFYTINIESPAYFFKINKRNLMRGIVFTDTLKTAFYDALHSFENRLAYAFSDPNNNGTIHIARLQLFKNANWEILKFNKPLIFHEGEAAFAASNNNIDSFGNWMWIATGGKKSRIIRLNKNHPNDYYEIFETPFIQGTSSQGIYSIDFYNEKFGIAVGGDYTKQSENINNIATTNDGGETWQIQASGKNAGYMTCVKIRPNFKGKEIIAVGDQHISYSSDFGKTWIKISDEKGLYTVEWVNKNTLVFAGKNRILKANFRDS